VGRLLLVGNSRWHWAERSGSRLRVWHEPAGGVDLAAAAAAAQQLEAWACVGHLPPGLALPPLFRVELQRVPLREAPAWLGVDRALAGWWAWQHQGQAVLVADAGTCLSLTRVDGRGAFQGGRLSAGLGLQLRALGQGTVQLPEGLAAADAGVGNASGDNLDPDWPQPTPAAMRQGCLRACAATVLQGWRDALADGRQAPRSLWLTGGDGPALLPLLRQQGLEPLLAPDLALEALAALA
jgi:type III pantothenate kinase